MAIVLLLSYFTPATSHPVSHHTPVCVVAAGQYDGYDHSNWAVESQPRKMLVGTTKVWMCITHGTLNFPLK